MNTIWIILLAIFLFILSFINYSGYIGESLGLSKEINYRGNDEKIYIMDNVFKNITLKYPIILISGIYSLYALKAGWVAPFLLIIIITIFISGPLLMLLNYLKREININKINFSLKFLIILNLCVLLSLLIRAAFKISLFDMKGLTSIIFISLYFLLLSGMDRKYEINRIYYIPLIIVGIVLSILSGREFSFKSLPPILIYISLLAISIFKDYLSNRIKGLCRTGGIILSFLLILFIFIALIIKRPYIAIAPFVSSFSVDSLNMKGFFPYSLILAFLIVNPASSLIDLKNRTINNKSIRMYGYGIPLFIGFTFIIIFLSAIIFDETPFVSSSLALNIPLIFTEGVLNKWGLIKILISMTLSYTIFCSIIDIVDSLSSIKFNINYRGKINLGRFKILKGEKEEAVAKEYSDKNENISSKVNSDKIREFFKNIKSKIRNTYSRIRNTYKSIRKVKRDDNSDKNEFILVVDLKKRNNKLERYRGKINHIKIKIFNLVKGLIGINEGEENIAIGLPFKEYKGIIIKIIIFLLSFVFYPLSPLEDLFILSLLNIIILFILFFKFFICFKNNKSMSITCLIISGILLLAIVISFSYMIAVFKGGAFFKIILVLSLVIGIIGIIPEIKKIEIRIRNN